MSELGKTFDYIAKICFGLSLAFLIIMYINLRSFGLSLEGGLFSLFSLEVSKFMFLSIILMIVSIPLELFAIYHKINGG